MQNFWLILVFQIISYLITLMPDLCSWQSHWWSVIIGSGNGLVPNWHQAITWTNDDQDMWFHTASESNHPCEISYMILQNCVCPLWKNTLLGVPQWCRISLGHGAMIDVTHIVWLVGLTLGTEPVNREHGHAPETYEILAFGDILLIITDI